MMVRLRGIRGFRPMAIELGEKDKGVRVRKKLLGVS
jgi:hypothetical protein